MELTQHVYRAENIKTIHDLHQVGIAHTVIAVFMAAEGIELNAQDVTTIVNSYDALGKEKAQSKKIKALIAAKKLGQHDESLPCPV